MARKESYSVHNKTKVIFLPMIDRPQEIPLLQWQKSAKSFDILTADQQIYKAVHVMWENQSLFGNLFIRLGGMHLLMSYVGWIDTLMADTGIVQVFEATFAGVLRMLSDKNYPDTMRALRMLTKALLRPLIYSTTH